MLFGSYESYREFEEDQWSHADYVREKFWQELKDIEAESRMAEDEAVWLMENFIGPVQPRRAAEAEFGNLPPDGDIPF